MEIFWCKICGKGETTEDNREAPYCSRKCRIVDHWHGHHLVQTCFYLVDNLILNGPGYRSNNSLLNLRTTGSAAIYYTSKICDIYALACTIYEVYRGRQPSARTHMNIVPLVRAMIHNKNLPPHTGEWTSEEKTIWWLVDTSWKNSARSRPEVDLFEKILKNIDLFTHLSPPKHISAFKKVTPLDSTNGPGTMGSTLSQGVKWVLDVDDVRSRHMEMFGLEIVFPDDKDDLLIEANEQILELSRSVATYQELVMAAVDYYETHDHPPSPPIKSTSKNARKPEPNGQRSSKSGSYHSESSSPSDDSEQSPASFEMPDLQDPTLRPNWRSRITRLGDRPLDLQYGSLSYLVSARRKLMSGSTSSGSSDEAWRNDDISGSDS